MRTREPPADADVDTDVVDADVAVAEAVIDEAGGPLESNDVCAVAECIACVCLALLRGRLSWACPCGGWAACHEELTMAG